MLNDKQLAKIEEITIQPINRLMYLAEHYGMTFADHLAADQQALCEADWENTTKRLIAAMEALDVDSVFALEWKITLTFIMILCVPSSLKMKHVFTPL